MATKEIVAQHTPGPWKVDALANSVRAMDDQMTVCDIRGWGYLTGVGGLHLTENDAIAVQTANARLIAAAPRLIAALENLIDAAVTDSDTCVICQSDAARHNSGCALIFALDAIAKAEGR